MRVFCFGYAVLGVQVHLLVLDAAPEALDEDIVTPASLAAPALQDAMGGKQRDKLAVGKLAARVGVEDLGPTVPSDRLLLDTTASMQKSVARLLESRQASIWRLYCTTPGPRPGTQSHGAWGCSRCPSPRPDWAARWPGPAAGVHLARVPQCRMGTQRDLALSASHPRHPDRQALTAAPAH